MRLVDISGYQFGLLTVTGIHDRRNRKIRWEAICECGNPTVVIGEHLHSGHTQSCGCLRSNGKSEAEVKFGRYIYDAAYRDIYFDLSLDDFTTLALDACYYCGDDTRVNGLDRVDNRFGYCLENVVTCCSLCNRMKGTLTLDQFLAHVQAIAYKAEA